MDNPTYEIVLPWPKELDDEGYMSADTELISYVIHRIPRGVTWQWFEGDWSGDKIKAASLKAAQKAAQEHFISLIKNFLKEI